MNGTSRYDPTEASPAPPRTAAEPNSNDPNADRPTVLDLETVAKTYGSERAVSDLSLAVESGEILALLGPSGCGKTTTLRLIGGLERPDEGGISLDGRSVADAEGGFVAPEERDIGLVFQDFALFPHLSAAENVAFGIEEYEAADREARVADLLDLVDLSGYGEQYPEELSGGQKQRIALARSLAPEPDVLLLDEPLSNLDVRLRVSMREEIRSIIEQTDVTAVWVTHDQEEALSVADRVGVMENGRLRQIGRPEAIFERPATRFVASFLGRAGFLAGRVENDGIVTDIGSIPRDRFGDLDVAQGTIVDVLVRPDDLRVQPTNGEPALDGAAHGEITRRQYQGPSFVYRVETTGGDTIHSLHNHTERFAVGERVEVALVAEHTLQWYPRA